MNKCNMSRSGSREEKRNGMSQEGLREEGTGVRGRVQK